MQKKKQARDMHETLVQSNTELAKHKVRQAEAEKEEERAIMKYVSICCIMYYHTVISSPNCKIHIMVAN